MASSFFAILPYGWHFFNIYIPGGFSKEMGTNFAKPVSESQKGFLER
jgi:hypothetical protein